MLTLPLMSMIYGTDLHVLVHYVCSVSPHLNIVLTYQSQLLID